MSEDAENWWERTPGDSKQRDPDAPETIVIRGYPGENNHWAKTKEEGDGVSESDPIGWSDYPKQKAVAIGIFLFSFLVGDWWWDGSNGFMALINVGFAMMDWPEYYSWTSDYHPTPILLVISWMLWDITPAVFLFLFLFGSNIIHSTNLKEDSSEIRRIGKKANRNLVYFVTALILMDLVTYLMWGPIDAIIDYPVLFFEWRPGIHWMFVALAASFGLNPDIKLLQ